MTNHRHTGCRTCTVGSWPVIYGSTQTYTYTTYNTTANVNGCGTYTVTASGTGLQSEDLQGCDYTECVIPSASKTWDVQAGGAGWEPASGEDCDCGPVAVDSSMVMTACHDCDGFDGGICLAEAGLFSVADTGTFNAFSVGFDTTNLPSGGGCSAFAAAIVKVTAQVVTPDPYNLYIRYYLTDYAGLDQFVKTYRFLIESNATCTDATADMNAQTNIGLVGVDIGGDKLICGLVATDETRIDNGNTLTILSGLCSGYGCKFTGYMAFSTSDDNCSDPLLDFDMYSTNTVAGRRTASETWLGYLCPDDDFTWGAATNVHAHITSLSVSVS